MRNEEHIIESIESQDWKKALGINFTGIETNSALTTRDYNLEYWGEKLICVIKGYFIWWCSTHHQPSRLCEIEVK